MALRARNWRGAAGQSPNARDFAPRSAPSLRRLTAKANRIGRHPPGNERDGFSAQLRTENLLRLFAAGEIAGTTHACLGQEYVAVALAPLLRGDFIVSNHRGHGHYLAHRGDAEALLAELTGREGGVSCGVGGSQHLRDDGYLSTGIQGEGIAVAAGVALHLRDTADRDGGRRRIGEPPPC